MLVRLTCAVSLLALAGCAPLSPTRLPPSMNVASAADAGMVFGSVGATTSSGGITDWSMLFRRVGTTDPGQFTYHANGLNDSPIDFTGDHVHGSVFFARLPAGEYEVYDIDMFMNLAQMGTRTFSSGQPVSIRFKVVPGRAVYLGEFVGQRVMLPNAFGTPVTAGAYFAVADKLQRDLALVAKKGQAIDAASVDDQSGAFTDAKLAVFRPAMQP